MRFIVSGSKAATESIEATSPGEAAMKFKCEIGITPDSVEPISGGVPSEQLEIIDWCVNCDLPIFCFEEWHFVGGSLDTEHDNCDAAWAPESA